LPETGFDLEKHGFIHDLLNLMGIPAFNQGPPIRPTQQAWDLQHWSTTMGGNYSGMAYRPGTAGVANSTAHSNADTGSEGGDPNAPFSGFVLSLAAALLAQQEDFAGATIRVAASREAIGSQGNSSVGGALASGQRMNVAATNDISQRAARRLSAVGDVQVASSAPTAAALLPSALSSAAEVLSRAEHYPGALKAAELAVGRLRPLLCEPSHPQGFDAASWIELLDRRLAAHEGGVEQAGAGGAAAGGVRNSTGGRGWRRGSRRKRRRGGRQGVCGCLRLGDLQVLGELEAELGIIGDFVMLTPLKVS
jgi:hypothetical protein